MSEQPENLPKPLSLFCSYAHKDEAYLELLQAHLAPLQRQGIITVRHNREIVPGTEWERAIDERMSTADIILLLISVDFLASDYAYGIEMRHALERHES